MLPRRMDESTFAVSTLLFPTGGWKVLWNLEKELL
jgi:hypothetical protein